MMPRQLSTQAPVRRIASLNLPVLLILLALASSPGLARAQMSPEEHRSHHPGAAETGSAPAATPGMGMMGKKGPKTGGMGGGMQEMMKAMARPKSTELFPTLIKLPELDAEQRASLLRQARQREAEGIEQLQQGFARLTLALGRDDLAAMRAEAAAIEEGLSRFRSGLAVRQALQEGVAPKRTALQWYKSQLNLLPPATMRSGFRLFGMSPFPLFICFFSLAIGLTLVTIYLLKVRRTTRLLERLVSEAGAATTPPPPITPPAPVNKTSAPPPDKTTETAGATLTFGLSGKSVRLQADETVLEAAERAGVEIDASCRSGRCGICTVRLLAGEVDMDCEDGLRPEDKARGMILACQARARNDLTIEA